MFGRAKLGYQCQAPHSATPCSVFTALDTAIRLVGIYYSTFLLLLSPSPLSLLPPSPSLSQLRRAHVHNIHVSIKFRC